MDHQVWNEIEALRARLAELELRGQVKPRTEEGEPGRIGVAESNLVARPPPKGEPGSHGIGSPLKREEIARESGVWARNALSGRHRGPCPRRALDMGSNVYVILSSYEGVEFAVPHICYTWKEAELRLNRTGTRKNNYGKATFVGWPSLHDARIFCEAAGCKWPFEE